MLKFQMDREPDDLDLDKLVEKLFKKFLKKFSGPKRLFLRMLVPDIKSRLSHYGVNEDNFDFVLIGLFEDLGVFRASELERFHLEEQYKTSEVENVLGAIQARLRKGIPVLLNQKKQNILKEEADSFFDSAKVYGDDALKVVKALWERIQVEFG